MEAQKTHRPPLRFCDYYSHMTLADFTVFQAKCEAGTGTRPTTASAREKP